ncbi:MAG: hypothetical protein QM820_25590 [Minicystis sp.]
MMVPASTPSWTSRIEHRREVALGEAAGVVDHLDHQIGLRDRILLGPEELVGAADDARVAHAHPVLGELGILEADSIRRARDREVDARAVRRVPVDVALIIRDVDAAHGGAVGAHLDGVAVVVGVLLVGADGISGRAGRNESDGGERDQQVMEAHAHRNDKERARVARTRDSILARGSQVPIRVCRRGALGLRPTMDPG